MSDTLELCRVVERAAAGDEQAWKSLVEEHGGRLRAVAAGFRLSRSDADDAMQATWIALFTNVGALRSRERVGAWLATTMRRNCLRILQRQRYEIPVDDLPSMVTDGAAAVDRTVVTAELAEVLWQTVSRLPPRQARLLRALFADGERPYQEIAAALAMPIGAIGPVRQRALHQLARLLDEAGVVPTDLGLCA